MDNLKEEGSNQAKLPSTSTFALPIINSEQLFQKGREVIIIHEDTTYKLIKTRNGKLILNK